MAGANIVRRTAKPAPTGGETAARAPAPRGPAAALIIAAAALVVAGVLALRSSSDTREILIARFAEGRVDTISLDLTRDPAPRRRALLATPLTSRINLGDVATEETCAAGPITIRRPVVMMLDALVTAITAGGVKARLAVCNGCRPPDADRADGGTGTGPHVRGDCLDVAFEIPGTTNREAAVRVANAAHDLNVPGIAIINDGARYLVHLDPIRSDSWHAEQVWQEIDAPQGARWATYYQGVDAASWRPAARPGAADELAGDWMATNIVSGENPEKGSLKSAASPITVFLKPNGHYGMRIPGDDLPQATALWDAVRVKPGLYAVQYSWPQGPAGKGVEEFRGTVQVSGTIAIRNTTQTNPAFPGEVTRVNARWERISPARRAVDPQLTFHDGVLWSRGQKCTGADETRTGGRYIDPVLQPARTYRESAPAFDSASRNPDRSQ